jgi:SseB protein N-terminal domain
LLVPVVAVAAPAERRANRPPERSADMALVTVRGRAGRRALPVFTGLEALAQWRADARPVPVEARRAALAGLAEGVEALLIDPAGPRPYVLTGPPLRALAEGRVWLPALDDPEVVAAVGGRARAVRGVVTVRLEFSTRADLRVVVEVAGTDPESVARSVAERLAADEVLRARLLRGVDVAAVAAPSHDHVPP